MDDIKKDKGVGDRVLRVVPQKRELPPNFPNLKPIDLTSSPARQSSRLDEWQEKLFFFLIDHTTVEVEKYFREEIEPRIRDPSIAEAEAAKLLSEATQSAQKVTEFSSLADKRLAEMKQSTDAASRLISQVREEGNKLRADSETYRKEATAQVQEDVAAAGRKAGRAQRWTIFGGLVTLAIAAGLVHYQNISNLATTIAQDAKKKVEYVIGQVSALRDEFKTYVKTADDLEQKNARDHKRLKEEATNGLNQVRTEFSGKLEKLSKEQEAQARNYQDKLDSQDKSQRQYVQMHLDETEARLTLRIGDLGDSIRIDYEKLIGENNRLDDGIHRSLSAYSALAKALSDTRQTQNVMNLAEGALSADLETKTREIAALKSKDQEKTRQIEILRANYSSLEARFNSYEQQMQQKPVKRWLFK